MHKNRIMLLTVCFMTLAHGAASSSSTSIEDQAETAIVGITSLYDVHMIEFPTEPMTHVPFVAGYNYRPHAAIMMLTKSISREFRGYVGCISGVDRNATVAIAEIAKRILSAGYNSEFDAQLAYAINASGQSYNLTVEGSELMAFNGKFLDLLNHIIRTEHPGLGSPLDDCKIDFEGWVGDAAPQSYLPSYLQKQFAGLSELATIKAHSEKQCRSAQRKDPTIKLAAIPVLVRRPDLTAFHEEAFSRQHKRRKLKTIKASA